MRTMDLGVTRPKRLCAFVNKASGERKSALFVYKQLEKHFGADNVFDLFPVDGKSPSVEAAKDFIAERNPDVVLVAGGDGTVSLAMDIVDAVRTAKGIDESAACIAVLPLGTGNDLSRSLGFGGGYTKPIMNASQHFNKILKRYFLARPKRVDRFQVTIGLVEGGATDTLFPFTHTNKGTAESADRPRQSSDDSHHYRNSELHLYREHHRANAGAGENVLSPVLFDEMKTAANTSRIVNVFTNYFSIGFDANIVKRFDQFRDRHPELCTSRRLNKIAYGFFGCRSMFDAGVIPRDRVLLEIDGKRVKVPSDAKALVIANTTTYAGGSVLWSDSHHLYNVPTLDDKKFEVSALNGVSHMVGVYTGTRSAIKIGQGSTLILYAPANLTMQHDGEPIRAMGTKDQLIKAVVELKNQSLGMQLQQHQERGGKSRRRSLDTPQRNVGM